MRRRLALARKSSPKTIHAIFTALEFDAALLALDGISAELAIREARERVIRHVCSILGECDEPARYGWR